MTGSGGGGSTTLGDRTATTGATPERQHWTLAAKLVSIEVSKRFELQGWVLERHVTGVQLLGAHDPTAGNNERS